MVLFKFVPPSVESSFVARPPALRKWGKYLLSFLIFLTVQFFNFNGTMYAMRSPFYDDSAGDMFVPLLLILPTLLLFSGGMIRVIYLISKSIICRYTNVTVNDSIEEEPK